MPREDVVHVLRRFRRALAPDGLVLDLQVVPPEPVVEVEGAAVCSLLDGGLLDDAAAAVASVDRLIRRGELVEDGVDDHHILHRYGSGAELVEDFETRRRSVPPEAVASLQATKQPCVIREACRLRRLRVPNRTRTRG